MFSGAGRISAKSRTLSPSLLSDYAFCYYNYKYDWLRPSLEEIFGAYNKKLYGKHGRDSDAESDDSSVTQAGRKSRSRRRKRVRRERARAQKTRESEGSMQRSCGDSAGTGVVGVVRSQCALCVYKTRMRLCIECQSQTEQKCIQCSIHYSAQLVCLHSMHCTQPALSFQCKTSIHFALCVPWLYTL